MPWKITNISRVRDATYPLIRATITLRCRKYDDAGNVLPQSPATVDDFSWNESNPNKESVLKTARDRVRVLNQMDVGLTDAFTASDLQTAIDTPPPPPPPPDPEQVRLAAIGADVRLYVGLRKAIAEGKASATDADYVAVSARVDTAMAGADRPFALSVFAQLR